MQQLFDTTKQHVSTSILHYATIVKDLAKKDSSQVEAKLIENLKKFCFAEKAIGDTLLGRSNSEKIVLISDDKTIEETYKLYCTHIANCLIQNSIRLDRIIILLHKFNDDIMRSLGGENSMGISIFSKSSGRAISEIVSGCITNENLEYIFRQEPNETPLDYDAIRKTIGSPARRMRYAEHYGTILWTKRLSNYILQHIKKGGSRLIRGVAELVARIIATPVSILGQGAAGIPKGLKRVRDEMNKILKTIFGTYADSVKITISSAVIAFGLLYYSPLSQLIPQGQEHHGLVIPKEGTDPQNKVYNILGDNGFGSNSDTLTTDTTAITPPPKEVAVTATKPNTPIILHKTVAPPPTYQFVCKTRTGVTKSLTQDDLYHYEEAEKKAIGLLKKTPWPQKPGSSARDMISNRYNRVFYAAKCTRESSLQDARESKDIGYGQISQGAREKMQSELPTLANCNFDDLKNKNKVSAERILAVTMFFKYYYDIANLDKLQNIIHENDVHYFECAIYNRGYTSVTTALGEYGKATGTKNNIQFMPFIKRCKSNKQTLRNAGVMIISPTTAKDKIEIVEAHATNIVDLYTHFNEAIAQSSDQRNKNSVPSTVQRENDDSDATTAHHYPNSLETHGIQVHKQFYRNPGGLSEYLASQGTNVTGKFFYLGVDPKGTDNSIVHHSGKNTIVWHATAARLAGDIQTLYKSGNVPYLISPQGAIIVYYDHHFGSGALGPKKASEQVTIGGQTLNELQSTSVAVEISAPAITFVIYQYTEGGKKNQRRRAVVQGRVDKEKLQEQYSTQGKRIHRLIHDTSEPNEHQIKGALTLKEAVGKDLKLKHIILSSNGLVAGKTTHVDTSFWSENTLNALGVSAEASAQIRKFMQERGIVFSLQDKNNIVTPIG